MLAVAVLVVAAAPVDGGASDAGVRLRLFEWEVPKLVAAAQVGQRLSVNGVPMVVTVARSSWAPSELLQHYAKRFETAGYFIAPRRLEGFERPQLVALDVDARVSYVVWVWPERNRTTSLVLGTTDMLRRTRAREAPPVNVGLPIFPGARGVTKFDLELARAVSFTVKATEAEVIDYYRTTLPAGGYVERRPGLFTKAQQQVRVLARMHEGTLGVVLLEEAEQPDEP